MSEGRRLQFMPMYVGEYLADTPHLTTAHHGAYLLLLMNYWQTGKPLDNDSEKLRAIARMTKAQWTTAKPVLETFFDVSPEKWNHKRVDHELAKGQDLYEKKVKAGKARAEQMLQQNAAHAQHVLESEDIEIPAHAQPIQYKTLQENKSSSSKSPSSTQRQVAKILGLKEDDERLSSVDQMLKDNQVKKPNPWINACATKGDLLARLEEAHKPAVAAREKAARVEASKCTHGVIGGLRARQCVDCEAVA